MAKAMTNAQQKFTLDKIRTMAADYVSQIANESRQAYLAKVAKFEVLPADFLAGIKSGKYKPHKVEANKVKRDARGLLISDMFKFPSPPKTLLNVKETYAVNLTNPMLDSWRQTVEVALFDKESLVKICKVRDTFNDTVAAVMLGDNTEALKTIQGFEKLIRKG